MTGPPSRADWTVNDDGVSVPRRTFGSIALGYSQHDFTLACKHCGDDYGNEPDLPMGVVQAHFEQHHPDVLRANGGKIELELLWLGLGPAPKGNPA